eukprot:scaffold195820_cov30-Tisochrysis_lutea.AAC.3
MEGELQQLRLLRCRVGSGLACSRLGCEAERRRLSRGKTWELFTRLRNQQRSESPEGHASSAVRKSIVQPAN